MADAGMRNLEKLTERKIARRLDEIRDRYLLIERQTVTNVAMVETMKHLSPAAARKLRYRPVAGGCTWGRPWSTRTSMGCPC